MQTNANQIFTAIHSDRAVSLSPDLVATKNPEALKDIMNALFEKQDWMKATSEEVASFVRKLSAIQENYVCLLAVISRPKERYGKEGARSLR